MDRKKVLELAAQMGGREESGRAESEQIVKRGRATVAPSSKERTTTMIEMSQRDLVKFCIDAWDQGYRAGNGGNGPPSGQPVPEDNWPHCPRRRAAVA